MARSEASSEDFVFVEDGLGKWYGIKKEELRRRAIPSHEGATLRSLLPQDPLPHVHPDHVLEEALRRLGDLPILPVVNRANFHKLEGVVGLQEILQAYRAAG
jgi:CIC family chloride channel protein